MTTTWLLLFLLPLVQLLGHYGYKLDGVRAAVLLPLVALPGLHVLARRVPGLFAPGVLRPVGLSAGIVGLAFVRAQHLLPLDLQAWQTSLQLAFLGLASAWVAMGSRERGEGPGEAFWAGAWLLGGLLDPTVPFLGLGLAATLRGFDLWPTSPAPDPAPAPSPFLAALLLGLALPKPVWDHAHVPGAAWGAAAFGLGLGLARLRRASLLPRPVFLGTLGALFVLYHPAALIPWGLALGAAAAWTLPRDGRRFGTLAGGFLLGLVLSFALHANA